MKISGLLRNLEGSRLEGLANSQDPVLEATPVTSSAPPGGSAAKTWLRALETTARLTADPKATFPVLIDDLGRRFEAAPALLSDDECLSYQMLAERSRRYARWALALGLKPGDGVALLMTNQPDYVALWAGLTRVGVVVSLLNTQLAGPGLAHCLNLVRPAHVVVAHRLWDVFSAARPSLSFEPRLWSHGGGGGDRIDLQREDLSGEPAGAE